MPASSSSVTPFLLLVITLSGCWKLQVKIKRKGNQTTEDFDFVPAAHFRFGQEKQMGAEIVPLPSCIEDAHLLLVDDCPVDRKIVEKLLLKNGTFKVTTVDSGKKAMEVLGLDGESVDSPSTNEHKIDIVLTDYCMPQMNGYDLLKVVKEHNCLKSIPVVLMSSENNPHRISRCRHIGAEDFILKPLHVEDIQKLRSYIKPTTPTPKIGSKRKMPLDIMPESNGSERRPHLAGVAVA